jgi:hypothetical protein
MWKDLITLKFAFDVPRFLMGDFNETLLPEERSSGYVNHVGCRDLKNFLAICNLIEYPLEGDQRAVLIGHSRLLTVIFSSTI